METPLKRRRRAASSTPGISHASCSQARVATAIEDPDGTLSPFGLPELDGLFDTALPEAGSRSVILPAHSAVGVAHSSCSTQRPCALSTTHHQWHFDFLRRCEEAQSMLPTEPLPPRGVASSPGQSDHVSHAQAAAEEKEHDAVTDTQNKTETANTTQYSNRTTIWKARNLYASNKVAAAGRGEKAAARKRAYRDWSTLTEQQRNLWMKKATAQLVGEPPADEKHESEADEEEPTTEPNVDAKSPGCLFTWNGSWGTGILEVQRVVTLYKDRPTKLHKELEKCEYPHRILEKFWDDMKKYQKTLKWTNLTCSVEVSLASEEVGRLHLHCAASFPDERRLRCAKQSRLVTFGDQLPSFWVPTLGRKGKKGIDRALREAHYYLQAPKIGRIAYLTDWPKFTTMLVDGMFIQNLYRNHKMMADDALLEWAQCRDKGYIFIENLKRDQAASYGVLCRQKWLEECERWERQANPFVPPCEIETEWLMQYAALIDLQEYKHTAAARMMRESLEELPQTRQKLRRYKFMIWDGPSGTGKTERAQQWFGAATTLTVNCKNTLYPNLRDWMTGKYNAVIFDEAKWKLVSELRALFQASARPIQLAQSPVNRDAYEVQMGSVPMMVTSNAFWLECDDEDAREWIDANAFYVNVTSPMFCHGPVQA